MSNPYTTNNEPRPSRVGPAESASVSLHVSTDDNAGVSDLISKIAIAAGAQKITALLTNQGFLMVAQFGGFESMGVQFAEGVESDFGVLKVVDGEHEGYTVYVSSEDTGAPLFSYLTSVYACLK